MNFEVAGRLTSLYRFLGGLNRLFLVSFCWEKKIFPADFSKVGGVGGSI
jgi:hypothetical protein